MSHPPIYVVRHGETDWNAEERLQGQTERALNATGEGQALGNGAFLARRLGREAERFVFVASPMRRARRTMEIIRAELGLPQDGYRTDERLKELSFGDWEGRTLDEVEAVEPGSIDRREADKWNFVPPGEGAESYALLAERVRPWFEEALGGERPVVSVSHGGIVRSIMHLCGSKAGDEASAAPIPQDRVGIVEDRRFRWL